jgi:hypothetical protein
MDFGGLANTGLRKWTFPVPANLTTGGSCVQGMIILYNSIEEQAEKGVVWWVPVLIINTIGTTNQEEILVVVPYNEWINQGESEEFLFNDWLVMTECMISFSIVECGFGHDELSCYIYYFDEKG